MSRKDNEKKETKPRKTEETSIGREIWEYVKIDRHCRGSRCFLLEQVIVINARIPSPSMEKHDYDRRPDLRLTALLM